MCTCIQNFDSVASHLELAILSRKFRITEHAQSSVVEYFNFFLRDQFKFVRSAFSPGFGDNASKTSNLLRFSIFRITTLDPCHRRHEESQTGFKLKKYTIAYT